MKTWPAIIISALLLSGCFIPEDFQATLEVENDGTYTYQFEGLALYGPAISAMRNGTLPARDNQALRSRFAETRKKPTNTHVVYRNNGRVQINHRERHGPAQRVDGLGMLTLTRGRDGVFTVKAAQPSSTQLKMLSDAKVHVRGKVTIKLPPNAKVIEANGEKITDSIYKWSVNGLARTPLIRYQLAK